MPNASLRVRLTPKAGRSEIVRRENDVLHVRVAAPPVGGKANRALLELLADALHVRKTALSIKSGASSRDKVLEIEGLETAEMWVRLKTYLSVDDADENRSAEGE